MYKWQNEANIGDLKDGFVDFLQQLRYQDGDYDNCLLFVGVDGMSYKNMLTLKKYLQTHPDAVQRFKLMQLILYVWHTQWTNLSCIYETHLGEPLNRNLATIAWSSNKIGQALLSNPKKVDYYLEMQLPVILHNTQMLNCWRSVIIYHFLSHHT
jgi:hypothetical protein